MKAHVSVKIKIFKIFHMIVHLVRRLRLSGDRLQEPRRTASLNANTICMYNSLREKIKKSVRQSSCLIFWIYRHHVL